MSEVCTPRALKVCDETEIQSASDKEFECEPFSVCLPFGGSLFYNGGCINYEKGTPPADGTYGKIIIEGGCIVGVEQDTVPQYAATPCAPVPNPCDCGEGSGASISTRACNLITQDATGALQALLYVEGDNGVTISGCGTAERPLIISGGGGSGGGGSLIGDSIITVTSISNGNKLTHKQSPAGTTTVKGMTFDAFGHFQSYTEPSSSGDGLAGIVAGIGIDVQTNPNTQIATVSLKPLASDPTGTHLLGGYNVTTDKYGRVTGFSRAITSPAGTFTLGEYDVTTNALGSITNIVKHSGGGGGGSSSSIGLTAGSVSFYYLWDEYTEDDVVEVEVNLVDACQIRVDVEVQDACSYKHYPSVYVDGTRLAYGFEFAPAGLRAFAHSAITPTVMNPGTHVVRFAYDRTGVCSGGDESSSATVGDWVEATIYGTLVTQGEVVE